MIISLGMIYCEWRLGAFLRALSNSIYLLKKYWVSNMKFFQLRLSLVLYWEFSSENLFMNHNLHEIFTIVKLTTRIIYNAPCCVLFDYTLRSCRFGSVQFRWLQPSLYPVNICRVDMFVQPFLPFAPRKVV